MIPEIAVTKNHAEVFMTNLLAKGALAADVIPPPTLVIDFLYLGIPLGLVAGALLLAAVVAVYRRQRQRGRSRLRKRAKSSRIHSNAHASSS